MTRPETMIRSPMGSPPLLKLSSRSLSCSPIFRWEKSGPLVSETDCGMLTSAWRGERAMDVL
ncbi:hypothetical protein D3C77_720080 [compost metagenome]